MILHSAGKTSEFLGGYVLCHIKCSVQIKWNMELYNSWCSGKENFTARHVLLFGLVHPLSDPLATFPFSLPLT